MSLYWRKVELSDRTGLALLLSLYVRENIVSPVEKWGHHFHCTLALSAFPVIIWQNSAPRKIGSLQGQRKNFLTLRKKAGRFIPKSLLLTRHDLGDTCKTVAVDVIAHFRCSTLGSYLKRKWESESEVMKKNKKFRVGENRRKRGWNEKKETKNITTNRNRRRAFLTKTTCTLTT